MLKSLVLSGLLASGVGAFASTPFDNQPLFSPSTQAVVYDDESYTITLSVDELINYHFNNLYNFFNSYTSQTLTPLVENTTVAYNDSTYFVDEVSFDEGFEYVSYMFNGNSIFFGKYENTTYKFFSNDFTFAYSLDWNLDDGIYSSIKSAIELDIQANQPQPSAGFISALASFVTLLTSGIVALATGIASGVVGMAKALFLNSTATGLSIFGGLIAMFAGIALAVTLTTKVYQWITSLGN